MGQCGDAQKSNVITPAHDTDDIPLNSSAIAGHYHVMISYALADRSICHRLATYLIRDGFRVWFESNPIENEFNRTINKIIDNSDCILLCVSDTYSQTYRCQKEARYASDMKKKSIMVKVASEYQMNDWLSFIKPGKIQFQLSDNESDFKITYKLIIEEFRRIAKLHSLPCNRSFEISMPWSAQSLSAKERKYQPQNTDILFQKQVARRGREKSYYDV